MRIIALLPFLLLPVVGQAGIYKCEDNGEVIFSQTPCGNDAEEINVQTYSPPAATAADNETAAGEATGTGAAGQEEGVDDFLERRRMERQIASLERDRERLTQERDRKLASIREKVRRTNSRVEAAELKLEAVDVQDEYNQRIVEVMKQLHELKTQ